MRLNLIFSFITFLGTPLTAHTQKYSLGAKVGYITGFRMLYDPIQVSQAAILPYGDDFYDGWRGGVFIERNYSRFSLIGEVGLSQTMGGAVCVK